MKKIATGIITMIMLLLLTHPAQAECVDNKDGTYTYSGELEFYYVTTDWIERTHWNTGTSTTVCVSNITGTYEFTTESPVVFYWNTSGLQCLYVQNGTYAGSFPGSYTVTCYTAICDDGKYSASKWTSYTYSPLPIGDTDTAVDNPYYDMPSPNQAACDMDLLLNKYCMNVVGSDSWLNNTINNMGFPIFDSYAHAKAYIEDGSTNGMLNADTLEVYESTLVLPEHMEVTETDTENHVYTFNVTYPECGQFYVRGSYYFEVIQGDMIFTSKTEGVAAAFPSSPYPILSTNSYSVEVSGLTSEDHTIELYDSLKYDENIWESLFGAVGEESSKSDFNVKNLITYKNVSQDIEKVELVIELQTVYFNGDGSTIYGDTVKYRYDCHSKKSSYHCEDNEGIVTETGDQGAGYVDMIPGPSNATLFTHDKTVFTFDWYMDTLTHNSYDLGYTLSFYYEYRIHGVTMQTDRILISSMEQMQPLNYHNTITGIGSTMDWSSAAVYCPDGVDIYNYLRTNAETLDLLVVYQNGYYETSRLGSYWTKGREYTYRYNIIKNVFTSTEKDDSGNILGSSGNSGAGSNITITDFLNFTKDGFGLLGNNGIVAFFGTVFSYFPAYIWTIITFGIVISIIVSLFVKAGK